MVIDERGEAEPDDPEFDVQTGEDLVPEPPSTGLEGESSTGSVAVNDDVRKEVAASFWATVFLLKPALFGLTLGPMVLYFTDYTRGGIAAVVIGLFSALAVYHRYRAFKADPPEHSTEPTDGSDSG